MRFAFTMQKEVFVQGQDCIMLSLTETEVGARGGTILGLNV